MEFDSPQTIDSSNVPETVASSPQVIDSSVPSVRVAAPAIADTVNTSDRSETIEHVISSPRSSVSSEQLDVLGARAEAARAAQEAAEARLRFLEARARSSRNSQASRSSRRSRGDRRENLLDPRAAAPANNNIETTILPLDIGAGVGIMDESVTPAFD